jgi:hypothetical protein
MITLHVGTREYRGTTTNVSRGGLAADLPNAIATDTEVEVDLQLVFDDDAHSEPLRIGARVVWCTTVDDAYQVGLAFKPLPAETAQYLVLFLRYLDDSGPRVKAPKAERSIDDQFR